MQLYKPRSTPSHSPDTHTSKQGGAYTLSLFIGDSSIAEDVQWNMGTVTVLYKPLEDGSQPPLPAGLATDVVFTPKKQILHMHRYGGVEFGGR